MRRGNNPTLRSTYGGSFRTLIEHFHGVQCEERENFPHAKQEESIVTLDLNFVYRL